jgi:hypothetical protein
MVKYDLTLKQAASELGIDLTVEEAHDLTDRKLFEGILEEKRLAHYTEIGSNPKLTKEAVVGMVFKLAERLANDREDFKSAEALLKLAKMQGWVGAESDSLWKTVEQKIFECHENACEVEHKERTARQGARMNLPRYSGLFAFTAILLQVL